VRLCLSDYPEKMIPVDTEGFRKYMEGNLEAIKAKNELIGSTK